MDIQPRIDCPKQVLFKVAIKFPVDDSDFKLESISDKVEYYFRTLLLKI